MGSYTPGIKWQKKMVQQYVREEYPLSNVTARIIAAATEVHRTLGPGFEEVIYQRALALELPAHNLEFDREVWIDVYYKGAKVGRKRVDFVIDEVSEIPCKTPCPLCLRSDNERNYASPVSAIKAFSASVVLTGRPT